MIWIHKSTSNEIEYYKFWNYRTRETRIKINIENLTILGVYAATEGREKSKEEFYGTLQKILHKVDKNDHTMLTGDKNARVGKK
jgi:CRISPR/Cas system CSM-associated protein Csm2 small subunit